MDATANSTLRQQLSQQSESHRLSRTPRTPAVGANNGDSKPRLELLPSPVPIESGPYAEHESCTERIHVRHRPTALAHYIYRQGFPYNVSLVICDAQARHQNAET